MNLQRESIPERLSFGDFTIDPEDERLYGPAGPVKIGNKAFQVLLALVEQDGRLLTKEALFASVWDGTIVSESALTSVVKELRRALGDGSRSPSFIESVYGRGYRFLAPVTRAAGIGQQPAQTIVRERPHGVESSGIGEPPLVLVSPFNDQAVAETYPYCAEELREEVLSGLARFREIQLVAEEQAPNGSRHLNDTSRGYRLSATLLPDQAGVKVIARASRLGDGRVVWAETLLLGGHGTATGVDRIVRRIVGSALPAVDADVTFGLPAVSDGFYDRYLIAKRRSLVASDIGESRKAAEELEQLIAERPDFGLAYPPLVRLYNTDFGYTALGSSGDEERDRALELAKAGLAADPGNVHAYTVLAFCHLYHGQHRLAAEKLEQALTLNPYNASRLNEVAAASVYLGDFDRARSLFDMGLHLQRFADDSYREDRGRLEFLEGDDAAAQEYLLALARPSIWSELYLALARLRSKDPEASQTFAVWRARVEACWHCSETPTAEQMVQWVRRHHPFVADSGEPLFRALEAALDPEPPLRRTHSRVSV